ncbi:site-specific integrase [Nocardia gamkensis]|uniref:site-specific integrase n=1 Tax=Nocardia gamkensis TaxID=352869 RepID=UPI0036F07B93
MTTSAIGDTTAVTNTESEVFVPVGVHIEDFLTDLANANKPANTIRAYRGDLNAFADHYAGDLKAMGVEPVRAFLAAITGQAPATRKRKRAAVSAFCRWAVRHDRMPANPLDKVDTITVPRTLPRPVPSRDIYRVLDAICARRPRKDVPIDVLRDRVLFETAYQCGTRASEACGLYVEDFDLALDDEHVRVHGKGGTVRTVLLDDRGRRRLIVRLDLSVRETNPARRLYFRLGFRNVPGGEIINRVGTSSYTMLLRFR